MSLDLIGPEKGERRVGVVVGDTIPGATWNKLGIGKVLQIEIQGNDHQTWRPRSYEPFTVLNISRNPIRPGTLVVAQEVQCEWIIITADVKPNDPH